MQSMLDLSQDKRAGEIVSRLAAAKPEQGAVCVSGTWGSYAPLLAAHIAKTLNRPLLYISPHIDDADRVCDDLQTFCDLPVHIFSVWEDNSQMAASDEIGSQRLRLALEMHRRKEQRSNSSPLIISTCVQALIQPVARAELIEQRQLDFAVGKSAAMESAVEWLVSAGFERTDMVDSPGQFACRGGILDIYAMICITGGNTDTSRQPQAFRVEYFGDEVESIRHIDLDTQRSGNSIEQISIVGLPSETADRDAGQLFLETLPPDMLVYIEEPLRCAEVSEVFLNRLDDVRGLYPWAAIYRAMQPFGRVEISRFSAGGDTVHLNVNSAQEFERRSGDLWQNKRNVLETLVRRADDHTVYLYCENAAEAGRVREIVGSLPETFHLPVGFIHQGFIMQDLKTIVVSHHELFGQSSIRRQLASFQTATPIDSLLDLHKGDYVVHVSYGIGRFAGLETIEKGGHSGEYLTLEYADKVKLHVPVSNVHLVHKFIGSMPRKPILSRIGTKKWEKQKDQVRQGAADLAAELLEIQASRQRLGGYAFGADTAWQKEFEEAFAYQETPDQITASSQIKGDMAAAIPMDRLLCGDVGYGKTELAMRAAFKAIQAQKQVAVLTPTTVLCVQHGRTFAERFSDFPVVIEVLNRFTPSKEIRRILEACRQGRVDILIGTHRILSDDVSFRDLGLLIIDEEQRFGVEHKERLKRFRVNIDVLTMTATPIPRTLHLSMLGLRDISSLATAPLDRRSVATRVCRFDPDLIRKAILFELSREGQIFFVYNRVQTIEKAAQMVRDILKDPSIVVEAAHGQMHRHDLEEAMVRFVQGKTQVLVCSTIIEAGLDIPNANTMIICDADRFGLAQLHQLRGRVGRYKHRAFAYLLLPQNRPIQPIAAKRLKAIEEFSQLGAGFRIALRDLEIRGAGNILGAEQSGHINTVGYEMYCRLLSEAVKKLKNEPIEQPASTVIDLGFHAVIPKQYIASDRQRMEAYRRIGKLTNTEDIRRFEEELRDLFGAVPRQTGWLLDMTELKLLACRWKIKSIVVQNQDVIFQFESGASSGDLFARSPGRVSIPDPNTVYVRLEKAYLEPATLLSILKKLLKRKPPAA